MGNIPVSEEEIGYWYPIGDNYYFCSKSISYYSDMKSGRLDGKQVREGTFKDFKKMFPNLAYKNSSVKYRTK